MRIPFWAITGVVGLLLFALYLLLRTWLGHEAETTAQALRGYLGRSLPEFMVPACYVQLDALPLTANGKLDRRALPAPDSSRPQLAVPYMEPVGPVEQQACAVFGELLGLDRVGRDDNFFDLGGDSLSAARAVIQLGKLASHELTLPVFFQDPTPAALAKAMTGKPQGASTASRLSHGERGADAEPVACGPAGKRGAKLRLALVKLQRAVLT